MKAMSQNDTRQRGAIDDPAEETDTAEGVDAPRRLTMWENVILTMKVFAIAVALGFALWGLNLWTSPR